MSSFVILSFLPILILLFVSLIKGVKPGVFTAFIVTAILFFGFGNAWLSFFAVIFSAFIGTINILMIIFGAVFLYYVMEQKGYILGISDSLQQIHPDKSFRFYFLAFFLTAFFESVAGFGTPGAIVPLLLMSMGYNAVLSIAVVLLLDGLFAMCGAVGTPVTAGLENPLNLTAETVGKIYRYTSLALFISGIAMLLFIQRFVKRYSGTDNPSVSWVLFLAVMVPFVLLSTFTRELTGLIASVVMALIAYVLLFRNRKLMWKPWLPYCFLIALLLIPKFLPWFATVLAYRISFTNIFGTDVSASLQPFRSPLIPFLAASAFALFRVNDFTLDLKPVISRTFAVFVILFPSLGITQLMLVSGGEFPSMVEGISSVFVSTGNLYPLVSPLIGVLGAFISGSTTVSNLIFGPAQLATGQTLGIPAEIVLSLQLAGASLGNAVCLFNIIAAAAVAGVKDYKSILTLNLLPILITSLLCSILGYLLL